MVRLIPIVLISIVLLISPCLAVVSDISLISPVDYYNTTSTTPTFSFNATSNLTGIINFTNVGHINDGGAGHGAWDGTYIYLANGLDGLRAYTFNGTTFTNTGHIDDGGIGNGVWGDGTYIYLANDDDGLRAYTFDGTTFTNTGHIDDGGYGKAVWGDGTYIYLANHDDGLRAYTFDGTTFTNTGHINDGGYGLDVLGDGTYIYLANWYDGLRAYTFGTPISLNCSLYLNDSSYANNDSVANTINTNLTASEISDGLYGWYITCTDDENSANSTTRTIRIDSTPPVINWVTTGGTYTVLDVMIAYKDTNLDTCRLIWDGTEGDFANYNSTHYWSSKTLSGGRSYTAQAYCNDSSSRTNYTDNITLVGQSNSITPTPIEIPESYCGDGSCDYELEYKETHISCPQDCPACGFEIYPSNLEFIIPQTGCITKPLKIRWTCEQLPTQYFFAIPPDSLIVSPKNKQSISFKRYQKRYTVWYEANTNFTVCKKNELFQRVTTYIENQTKPNIYLRAGYEGNTINYYVPLEIKLLGQHTTECGNGICEAGENAINCPQDCKVSKLPWYLIIGLVVSVVLIISMFLKK